MIIQEVDSAFVKRFERLTKRDLSGFVRDYITFMQDDYQSIYDYVQGNLSKPNAPSFKEFERLFVELNVILSSFESYRRYFTDVQAWNVLEILENIAEFFKTTKKLNRYLQTSITVASYQDAMKVDYAANAGQDLKSIEKNVVGDSDYANSWVDLGIENSLNEEDYDYDESYAIKVPFSRGTSIKIDVIFNGIESTEDMYGTDIDIDLIFENGDWRSISGASCLKQGAEVKMGLVKGDNPLYPSFGLPKGIIGSNRGTVAFPVIIRSYNQLFASDDRFTQFTVQDITFDKDGVYLEADIRSKVNDSIELTKKIS